MEEQKPDTAKQPGICTLISGSLGTENLENCIQKLQPISDNILLIDTEHVPEDLVNAYQLSVYGKKSLNDVLAHLFNDQEITADWLLFTYANEVVEEEPAEFLKQIAEIPANVNGIRFPVRSVGLKGVTEKCEFETRCVRLQAQPYSEFLDKLQVEGAVSKSRLSITKNLSGIKKKASSPAFVRLRDSIVRYWERYPEDLAAAFAFYQFLQWTDDYDEVVNNCMRTLEQGTTALRDNSEYWGLFTIWGEACYQMREREKFNRVAQQAFSVLPESHPDALFLKSLRAKIENNHDDMILNSKLFVDKVQKQRHNSYYLAQNGVRSLKYEVQVRGWRIVSLAQQQRWQSVFAGVRALTNLDQFSESKALDLLQDLQLIATDKSTTILTTLWKNFASPGFVLETLKIFPLDSLHEEGAKFLVDELTPAFMQKQEFEAGMLFMQMGLFEFAYEIFTKYKNDPGVGEPAMFNGAQMALEIGQFEEAIQLLADLLHEYPANKDARLLYEGLTPDVGTVENADLFADIDIEETLLEAVDAINYYVEKNKYDPILSLVKQVHDVMAPYSEIQVEIYGDLPKALARIESLAISHCYLKVAEKLQELRRNFTAVKADEKTAKH